METIKITRCIDSKVTNYDLENLTFGKIFTDHMFTADFDGEKWTNIEIRPVENFSIPIGNMALHYGQSIFEGMKASMHKDGYPLLIRPELHARRLNASAHRMCMPEFPEELFLKALYSLVYLEKDWIPKNQGSALYIRPFMFATDHTLGVRESTTYKMVICTQPAGPYYANPVKLKVEDQYIRAAVGGVGEAKTAGNYAASLYPTKLAKKEGYDQVMWLDAKEFKYIQEIGTMNIFFVIGDTVVTPATDGAILHGLTRDMTIHFLRDEGYNVEVRPIAIDEIVEAYQENKLKEVFGTGTAAILSKVSGVKYRDFDIVLDPDTFSIATKVKAFINQLRTGDVVDRFNWTIKVEPSLFED